MKKGSLVRYQQKPYSRCTSSKASDSKLTSVLRSKLSSLKSVYQRKEKEEQLINNRRQNYLNSFFNIRKNRLVQITKQNKKIHQRINQQQSYYSSRDLSKSYQSNCSNSRQSISRSSSRKGTPSRYRKNSVNSSGLKNQLNNYEKKASSLVTIQAQNVCKMNEKNIAKFATMFGGNRNNSKQNTVGVRTHTAVHTHTVRTHTKPKQTKPKQIFSSKNKRVEQLFPNLKSDTVLHKIVQQIALNPFQKRRKIYY